MVSFCKVKQLRLSKPLTDGIHNEYGGAAANCARYGVVPILFTAGPAFELLLGGVICGEEQASSKAVSESTTLVSSVVIASTPREHSLPAPSTPEDGQALRRIHRLCGMQRTASGVQFGRDGRPKL